MGDFSDKRPIEPDVWSKLRGDPCLLCPKLDCALYGCQRERTAQADREAIEDEDGN